MEKDVYYIPKIEDVYIGMECEKYDTVKCFREQIYASEAKAFFGIIIEPKRITYPYFLTERDIQYYTLNPHHLTLDLRFKRPKLKRPRIKKPIVHFSTSKL